jgi:hypothetical protein
VKELSIFLSFGCPKERNKEKDTTKTNSKLALVAPAKASVPSNLQFTLFVDGRRTDPNLERCVGRKR